ncbi:MAG: Lrp/AsnC family transcriptional regulator [Firmicutes bacterium]|nr:Lrp/AsnC family transcriptional regulator [Bacillota bacterium]
MGKTGLTGRRKQFLEELVDLYRRTNLPVHYESLARVLGVSKWTAYDMLKTLEQMGYVRRNYALHRGEGGRSVIVFSPTPEAEKLFEGTRRPPEPEEWDSIRAQVGELIVRVKEMRPGEAVETLLQNLPRLESRVAFCAHLLGLLVVYIRQVGGRTRQLVERLVAAAAPEAESRLSIFVAVVTGTVIQTLSQNLSVELVDLVGRFLKDLQGLGPREHEMLGRFLDSALRESG